MRAVPFRSGADLLVPIHPPDERHPVRHPRVGNGEDASGQARCHKKVTFLRFGMDRPTGPSRRHLAWESGVNAEAHEAHPPTPCASPSQVEGAFSRQVVTSLGRRYGHGAGPEHVNAPAWDAGGPTLTVAHAPRPGQRPPCSRVTLPGKRAFRSGKRWRCFLDEFVRGRDVETCSTRDNERRQLSGRSASFFASCGPLSSIPRSRHRPLPSHHPQFAAASAFSAAASHPPNTLNTIARVSLPKEGRGRWRGCG